MNSEEHISPRGHTWDEVRGDLMSPGERATSRVRVALMEEMIRARTKLGISQKKLETLSGVAQPVISRMELGSNAPNLDTILKVLRPLGKTMAIVDLIEK
jgi:DNA-binding XRE family transcriptional regulator